MPSPFDLPFVQRGVVEMLVLAFGAGIIGTWIVLRGLAFYAHAVGTAAFPGLVLADGLAFPATVGAASTGLLMASGVSWLGRGEISEDHGPDTALVLVAALAGGVILASDVFHSGSNVETLLFGSLLLVDWHDIAFAAVASGAAVVVAWVLHGRWLLTGFDPGAAPALGVRSRAPDAALLVVVTLLVVAALSTLGALLATAVLVVPAATTRLLFDRIGRWQRATVVLVALEGIGGLWLSVKTNAPPGPAIAALSGGVFAAVACMRALRSRHRAAVALAGTVLLLGAVGCGSSSTASFGQVRVVATTTQLGDIVRAVGGNAVDVTQILSPNTDPHGYEPRPDDVLRTARAQMVFENGDGLDRWMGNVVKQSSGHPAVVDLSKDVPVRLPGSSGPDGSREDPHWWHDPRNVEAAVTAIGVALGRARPVAAARFARQARAYRSKVAALDAGLTRCFSGVPRDQRKLVTDHDAFGYFAHRYGITVVGAVIGSQSTQAQASARTVARLSALIEREHVRAVFPESSLNRRLVQAIGRQTGATANSALYGDTLGPAGSRGDTYLHMEAANGDAMIRGFTSGARGCAPRVG